MGYRTALAVVLTALLPTQAEAVSLQCADPELRVTAATETFAEDTCATAAAAVRHLEACGFPAGVDVEIVVTWPLTNAAPQCLATADCQTNVIEIGPPAELVGALPEASPLRGLPSEVIFDSLIAHELAHVLAAQGARGSELTLTAQEYLAYAMQLDVMPEAARAQILSEYTITSPVPIDAFGSTILAMAPYYFAGKAWTHFSEPQNGCSFVRDVIAARVLFPELEL